MPPRPKVAPNPNIPALPLGGTSASAAPSAKVPLSVFGSRGCSIPRTEERAITLNQLKIVFAKACDRCSRERWCSTAPGRGAERLTRDTINLYDLVTLFLRPVTQERQVSLVELIADGPQPPDWFVSHWWGEPVKDFIACLEQHAKDRGLGGRTRYWVCAYANNQWKLGEEISSTLTETTFYKALTRAQGTVVVADRGGVVYTRVWCGYEQWLSLIEAGRLYDVYTTLEGGRAVGVTDGIASVDAEGGADTYRGAPSAKLRRESAFPVAVVSNAQGFDVAQAQASDEGDRLRIMAAITDKAALNATVAASLGAVHFSKLVGLRRGAGEAAGYLAALRASKLRGLAISADVWAHLADVYAGSASVGEGVSAVASALARVAVGGTRAVSAALIDALPPTLTQLELTAVPKSLVGAGVKALATGAIVHLTVARVPLGGRRGGAVKLATALGSRGSLQHLDLSGGRMGRHGMAAWARPLAACVAMRALSLQGSGLDDSGAAQVAAAIAPMALLEVLKVDGNSLRDAGASALAASLAGKARLRVLRLNNNCIRDAGAAALATAVGQLQGALQEFGLNSNLLTSQGARALAGMYAGSGVGALGGGGGGPAVLRVKGNLIGDEGGEALARAVAGAGGGRTLDLRSNWLGAKTALSLRLTHGQELRAGLLKIEHQLWTQAQLAFAVGAMWILTLWAMGTAIAGAASGESGGYVGLRVAAFLVTAAVCAIISGYVADGLLLRLLGNGAVTFHALSGWREYAFGTVMLVLFAVSVGLNLAIAPE